MQAIGHRQLVGVIVEVHRPRQDGNVIQHPGEGRRAELASALTAAATARNGKAHFGRAAVASRPFLVQMRAATAAPRSLRVYVHLHLHLQVESASADDVHTNRSYVEGAALVQRADARDRGKVDLTRIGGPANHAAKLLPRDTRSERATQRRRAVEETRVEAQHKLKLRDNVRRVHPDGDANLRGVTVERDQQAIPLSNVIVKWSCTSEIRVDAHRAYERTIAELRRNVGWL